ncbi:hypothetical protein [Nonomuraea solani]|uniref:hypothetical protein n=1 Tax=Nonomuraea solani TaxID=1144553 RepID=UPI0011B03F6C|nr:hypothetical protein [Nonomuraea solani]
MLLVPLFAGLVVAGAAHWPSSGTLAEFREAVAAGEVDRVNYRAANGELMSLTWSESPLGWHEVESEFADQGKPYTTQRLMDDVHRPAVQPSVTQESNSGSNSFPDWPFEATAGWWITGLWWLAFLAMFFSTPRLANRWAWFWLFTVGQIGVFFYLLLEPRPLWRGLGEGVPRAKRMDGTAGCGFSLLLAIAWALVSFGIGWLVKLVLG